eukprot:1906802-Pleurochrysis_carterae.AAC.2
MAFSSLPPPHEQRRDLPILYGYWTITERYFSFMDSGFDLPTLTIKIMRLRGVLNKYQYKSLGIILDPHQEKPSARVRCRAAGGGVPDRTSTRPATAAPAVWRERPVRALGGGRLRSHSWPRRHAHGLRGSAVVAGIARQVG